MYIYNLGENVNGALERFFSWYVKGPFLKDVINNILLENNYNLNKMASSFTVCD